MAKRIYKTKCNHAQPSYSVTGMTLLQMLQQGIKNQGSIKYGWVVINDCIYSISSTSINKMNRINYRHFIETGEWL